MYTTGRRATNVPYMDLRVPGLPPGVEIAWTVHAWVTDNSTWSESAPALLVTALVDWQQPPIWIHTGASGFVYLRRHLLSSPAAAAVHRVYAFVTGYPQQTGDQNSKLLGAYRYCTDE